MFLFFPYQSYILTYIYHYLQPFFFFFPIGDFFGYKSVKLLNVMKSKDLVYVLSELEEY